MTEKSKKESREKVWASTLEDGEIYSKNYLKVIIEEGDTNVWTYDDEKISLKVYRDGSLTIYDDDNWASINNLTALELLRDAIDKAIAQHKKLIKG